MIRYDTNWMERKKKRNVLVLHQNGPIKTSVWYIWFSLSLVRSLVSFSLHFNIVNITKKTHLNHASAVAAVCYWTKARWTALISRSTRNLYFTHTHTRAHSFFPSFLAEIIFRFHHIQFYTHILEATFFRDFFLYTTFDWMAQGVFNFHFYDPFQLNIIKSNPYYESSVAPHKCATNNFQR